ncbi:unnamed protein product [Paramecium octaurelia]|uniref:Uncharacterized protein n=1 Tax=Paramecium octaurelia TaxID=43137 RepID=A0A8S1UV67_PAROT|nr:unnamed protein product [Paramecium octaurelia]
MEYKLWITIHPEELEILGFPVNLVGNTSIKELYEFLLNTYDAKKVQNKDYTQWISKINGIGKFAYQGEQTISNIFGSMLNGQISIYTEPAKVPKDSELEILQTDYDSSFCVNFLLLDGSNAIKASLEFQCEPSTLFSDAITTLYQFSSYPQEIANFQFEKDGRQIVFDQKTTFRQLNIISNTTLRVKTRWSGGRVCSDRVQFSLFQQTLH